MPSSGCWRTSSGRRSPRSTPARPSWRARTTTCCRHAPRARQRRPRRSARLFRAVEDLLVLTRLEHDALLVTWEPISLVRAVDAAAESEGARWPASIRSAPRRVPCPRPPGRRRPGHVLRNLIADIGCRATDPIDLEIAVDADERRVSCRLMDTTQTLVDAELADYFALPLAEPRPGRVSPGIAVFVAGALVDAMGGSSWADAPTAVPSRSGSRSRATKPPDVRAPAGARGASLATTLPEQADDRGLLGLRGRHPAA
jgi:hypothetical protein